MFRSWKKGIPLEKLQKNLNAHVTIKFLPAKTTSCLQPLDAGIISQVKALYRKRLLRHVLAEMNEADTARELAKSVNLLDAISWLDMAWNSVDATTIPKCFKKCGFEVKEDMDDAMEPIIEVDPLFDNLLGSVSWEDYVNMDNDESLVHAPPAEIVSDEQTNDDNEEQARRHGGHSGAMPPQFYEMPPQIISKHSYIFWACQKIFRLATLVAIVL